MTSSTDQLVTLLLEIYIRKVVETATHGTRFDLLLRRDEKGQFVAELNGAPAPSAIRHQLQNLANSLEERGLGFLPYRLHPGVAIVRDPDALSIPVQVEGEMRN